LKKEIAFEIKSKGDLRDLDKMKKISGKIGIEKSYVISKEYVDFEGVVFPMFL